jgi:hypothetical protein
VNLAIALTGRDAVTLKALIAVAQMLREPVIYAAHMF